MTNNKKQKQEVTGNHMKILNENRKKSKRNKTGGIKWHSGESTRWGVHQGRCLNTRLVGPWTSSENGLWPQSRGADSTEQWSDSAEQKCLSLLAMQLAKLFLFADVKFSNGSLSLCPLKERFASVNARGLHRVIVSRLLIVLYTWMRSPLCRLISSVVRSNLARRSV